MPEMDRLEEAERIVREEETKLHLKAGDKDAKAYERFRAHVGRDHLRDALRSIGKCRETVRGQEGGAEEQEK